MSSLDRLQELLRRAEEKAVRQRIGTELQQAAEELSGARAAHEEARRNLEETRRASREQLEQFQQEELRLSELSRKAGDLADFLEDQEEVQRLLRASLDELESGRSAAERRLQQAEAASRQTLERLQSAVARYRHLRELGRGTELIPSVSVAEQAYREAVAELPQTDLNELEEEVDYVERQFGALSRAEQFAQMKLWIGRLRRFQASPASAEHAARARTLFTRLVGISKDYQPGYIEAFRLELDTDWDRYIAEAEEELRRAVEQRIAVARAQERAALEQKLAAARRSEIEAALRSLRELTAAGSLSPEQSGEFLEILRSLPGEAFSDEELLALARPYAALVSEGPEFRALRRNLQKLEEREREPGDWIAPEVVAVTEGKRAVLFGGEPREAARVSLQRIFRFAELEWPEDRSGTLSGMEQRIANRSISMLIMLRSFVSHAAADRLVASCKRAGVPFYVVEQGYGASRIAEALRQRPTAVSP